jgi:hypothetical protein
VEWADGRGPLGDENARYTNCRVVLVESSQRLERLGVEYSVPGYLYITHNA